MAAECRDEVMVAQLITELEKIGTAPTSNWLTTWATPLNVTEGPPGDALPTTAALQLYLEHLRTVDVEGGDSISGVGPAHTRVMHVRLWAFALATAHTESRGRKPVRQLVADCVRALQAAEGTFQTLTASEGIRCGAFTTQFEMVPAGFAAGALDVTVTYHQEHSAP